MSLGVLKTIIFNEKPRASAASKDILLSESVKTIFSTFHLDSNTKASNKKYVTAHVNPIIDDGSWTFDITGFKVPRQKVVGFVETSMEF
jgi:hypothetical protein